MKRPLILLAIVIILYVGSSLLLHEVYGQSYPLWPGSDYWTPDRAGGWRAIGSPTAPQPAEPSETIPVLLVYLPFLLPGAFLFLALFTPMARLFERPPASADDTVHDGEGSQDDTSAA